MDSAWTYKASFYYKFPTKSSFRGTATVGLQTSVGKVLASKRVNIRGTTSWTKVDVELKPTASALDTNNVFVVTINGAGGQTINFAMFSLFPPTFKNRPNGMRIDIAEVNSFLDPVISANLIVQALVEMGPAFFRFPGGNNLVRLMR